MHFVLIEIEWVQVGSRPLCPLPLSDLAIKAENCHSPNPFRQALYENGLDLTGKVFKAPPVVVVRGKLTKLQNMTLRSPLLHETPVSSPGTSKSDETPRPRCPTVSVGRRGCPAFAGKTLPALPTLLYVLLLHPAKKLSSALLQRLWQRRHQKAHCSDASKVQSQIHSLLSTFFICGAFGVAVTALILRVCEDCHVGFSFLCPPGCRGLCRCCICQHYFSSRFSSH